MAVDASIIQFRDRANDSSVYPISKQDAILDSSGSQDLTTYIAEYNISLHQLNRTVNSPRYDTSIFTAEEAVAQVPDEYRHGGLKLTFNGPSAPNVATFGKVQTCICSNNTWSDASVNWMSEIYGVDADSSVQSVPSNYYTKEETRDVIVDYLDASLNDVITEYNISLHKTNKYGSQATNPRWDTSIFTLVEAVNQVPDDIKRGGLKLTFNSSSSSDSSAMDHVECYDLNSNIWSNDVSKWYRNDGKYNREKLTELESEENRNRIYLEDIDAVIAELPVNTTTWLPTFPIVLNAGDVVHITPMLSGITSLDGVYLYYSDGTRKAIYTWGSGKLKVVNIDKKVISIGFYYSSGTPTTDYIRFHYMGKAAILADIEPRISSLESAESILSANQQAIQTDIAAIENTANIVTISELTENELVQQSSVRIIYDRLIATKRIVGSIVISGIDIAVQYMDINANILYNSGWVRETEINTIGYTNVHTLRLIFRNTSATSISKTDVISHIIKISLKEYGTLLRQSDITGEGNTEYYGKAITLNIMAEKKYCNNVLLHTIFNREDITGLTSIQSLAIHDGVAVIPKDGTRFVIMDIASGELLYHGEFPQSHHNGAIQFSNTFYDDTDRFPLLLLSSGDYENPNNKAMVLRMSNDYTMTLIKEINCSIVNVQYNGGFVADFSTNRLWLYAYTNGSYNVRENNNVVIYEFTLPNIKTSESVTLSKDDILKETILPVCITQDSVAYGGKLWIPCSYVDYINGFPTSKEGMNENIIIVLNPNNGVIESAIKGVAGLEPQGIDFYNGKMYYTCKNSGVTEIGRTAFRFYEYSFNS